MKASLMKAMNGTALTALLLAAGCVSNTGREIDSERQAVIDESLREFCAMQVQLPCRENVSITLQTDEAGNSETFEFALLPPPLQNGYLSLLPGETVYLTGEFREGRLVNTRAANQPFKAPHLEFSFSQKENGTSMMLAVKSTFEMPVKYRMVMMRPESEDLLKTSSCPVVGNGGAYEMWPHAIFQLIVLAVMEADTTRGMVCEW